MEELVAVLDLDFRRLTLGILGAAGKEATDDELVDFLLVGCKSRGCDPTNGVYRWVGLIVVSA